MQQNYVWSYASESRRGQWTCPHCGKKINRNDDNAPCGATKAILAKHDYPPCWNEDDRRGKDN